jgi:hypothetical protein
VLFVSFERVFFITAHQINIELRHSRARERPNLFDVSFGRAKQAEAVGHFIRNEVAVAAVNLAVMQVIVFSAIPYIRG